MTYEEFTSVWNDCLSESGLRVQGWPRETFDLQHVERKYEVIVEPLAGQDAPPFYITALISWRWSALQFARTATSEADMLRELLGHTKVTTLKPWLRVDIKFAATLPYGEPMAMPTAATWKRWMRETMGRLERLQPILPKKTTRTNRKGGIEVLAWQQGQPELEAICTHDGTLLLNAVSLSAWQSFDVPRRCDDSERQDPHPHKPLSEMFSRLKASLHAWCEVMDHLQER